MKKQLKNSEDKISESEFLVCKYCGGKAIIEGTWAKAKVRCLTCGIERPVNEYREEIENLKERWIEQFCCQVPKRF